MAHTKRERIPCGKKGVFMIDERFGLKVENFGFAPGFLALVAGVSKTCGARFACSQFVRAMVPVATTILKIQGGGEDSK